MLLSAAGLVLLAAVLATSGLGCLNGCMMDTWSGRKRDPLPGHAWRVSGTSEGVVFMGVDSDGLTGMPGVLDIFLESRLMNKVSDVFLTGAETVGFKEECGSWFLHCMELLLISSSKGSPGLPVAMVRASSGLLFCYWRSLGCGCCLYCFYIELN